MNKEQITPELINLKQAIQPKYLLNTRQSGEALELLSGLENNSTNLIFFDPQYEPVRNVLRTDYPLYSQSDYQILRILEQVERVLKPKEDVVPTSKRKHPHQKPRELIKALIEATTNQGDLIVDPCADSFVVLGVCRELKREFLDEVEHRADYCHSRCGNDCDQVCGRCNRRTLTTKVANRGDNSTAALRWAVGEAQRQAKLTGKTGEIEVAVPSLDASGSDGRFIYDKLPEKEYKLIKVNFATGDQFTKIAFLRSKDGTGTVTPEQGEDGKQKQIIETVPKNDLICSNGFRTRIYDQNGKQIVEVVDHQIHHTDDGNTISVRTTLPPSGGGDQQKSSQESQQTDGNKISEENSKSKEEKNDENIQEENKTGERSGKEESIRKENIENASIGSQDCLVHSSAKVDINEVGNLIYPVEIFTDSERKALSEVLNNSLLVNFVSSGKFVQGSLNKNNYRSISLSNSSKPDNNTQQTNKGKNILIVSGVVFVLLVVSLAIVKKVEHRPVYGEASSSRCSVCAMSTLAYIQPRTNETHEEMIKQMTGEAQRIAKRTGKTGDIEVSRTIGNAGGEYQTWVLVYNTYTRQCHFDRS
ncbi:11936_t:CDS:2 [Funneliformis geosporum]|nr:11936_t:CDS:2 [Funneliformis geosporum]